MTADDDVFNVQHVNRELNCRKAIEIRVHHDISHVAVHKHFAGYQSDNLVCRHAAVRATNPEIMRRLLGRQPAKKIGILPRHVCSPGAIVFEQLRKLSHESVKR
ncbi:MAG TPA: hypothetical protein VLQ90_08680 [Pyrinomonadaceae bacterium]|nr:hypothetical protein [Pyrinomonadaceae bacterium]